MSEVMSDPQVKYLEDILGAVSFPYTTMLTSWFQVGWSEPLKAGDTARARSGSPAEQLAE